MSRRRLQRSVTLKSGPAKAQGVKLAVELGTDVGDSAKWVMVAREGIYLGYQGGKQGFMFTPETFEQIVKNAHAHPSFVAGEDGIGKTNLVPWDFDHASEQPPTTGSLPSTGAPAQAWTMDFQVRQGTDGKAELWALTQFLDPAKGYIKAGQYQWASVAVHFNATHPVTGQDMGATISSIALTNVPFIQGMEKLVANAKADVEARRFYDAADTPMEAVRMLKELFGKSETDGIEEIFEELGKMAQFVAAGVAPLGVDTEMILGAIRTILNMPPLMPDAEVITSALTQLQGVVENTPGALAPNTDAAPPPAAPTDEAAAAVAASASTEGTETMEILKALASALGVRENETVITEAVLDLVELRGGIKSTLGMDRDGTRVLLAEAKDVADGAKAARETLAGLFTALGVEDAAGSVNKVADLVRQADELVTAMPELKAFRTEKVERDAADVEKDVDEAIAANAWQPEMKDAMVLLHKQIGHVEFVKKWPGKPAADVEAKQQLTQPLVTQPGGTELRVNQATGQVIRTSQNAPAPAPAVLPIAGGQDIINLDVYDAPNPSAAAKAHLAATLPNWDGLDYDTQMSMAYNFKKQPNVVCTGLRK